MLITKRVRLINYPLLARKMVTEDGGRSKRRVFELDKNGRIKADLARWEWAFREACSALSLTDVGAATILPAVSYDAPKIGNYTRNFSVSGRRQTEQFESISTGSILTLEFSLTSPPPHLTGADSFSRPPDEVEFDQILSHIGERLGMSEWGNEYGYGRFALHVPPTQ